MITAFGVVRPQTNPLLQTIAEFNSIQVGRLVGLMIGERDPLTSGDIFMDMILREMAAVPEPLVLREKPHAVERWTLDTITITNPQFSPIK